MAQYTDSKNFATSNGDSAAYKLILSVSTQQVTGGTQATVTVTAQNLRNPGQLAWDTTLPAGTKAYSTPGGRVGSVDGNLAESGSAGWTYDFRPGVGTVVDVWYFNRFYKASYGSKATISLTVNGNTSSTSYLSSTTVSVTIDLFQNVTVPNLNGLSRTSANTTLSNAGLNASSSVVANSIGSSSNDLVVSNSQSPAAGTSVASGSTVSFQYYGTYVAPVYTVSYNYNGGSGSPSSVQVTSPNSTTLPTATRANYTFNGWFLGGSYVGTSGNSYTPSSSVTLVASWSAIQYTITFIENGGSDVSNITANVNSTVSLPTPSRSGYTFAGWYSNSSLTVGPYTSWYITANQTLYAKWNPIAPGFTDESITSSLYLNQDVANTSNRSVSATNATSYSIAYGGSNLNPTSWLTIDNSGNLSGSTNQVGIYSFIINATGIGGTTPSNIKTITVYYPGKRFNATETTANFTTARRLDSFGNWVPVTSMKRFDGTTWRDISN